MIIQHPTLYKKTSAGKTQIWRMEREGGRYRTITGHLDGKHAVGAWADALPTNIGRSNYRDENAQAEFEVNAQYTKKIDGGYFENLADIEGIKFFKPMLAKKLKDYKEKIPEETQVFIQPKLDGMRCTANRHGLTSRGGKAISGLPHITKALEEFFDVFPNITLDGELYNHEYKDDFNAIIGPAKTQKPDAEELIKAEKMIQYHIYDMFDPDRSGDPFKFRHANLNTLFQEYYTGGETIQNVQTFQRKLSDAQQVYEQFLELGYEGAMVRLNTPYENKKTSNLLKMTDLMTDEYELVDLQEGNADWKGKARKAFFKDETNGRIFKADVAGTREFCQKAMEDKDKLIGTRCTIEFRMLTPDGVPRFGKVKEFNRTDNISG